MKGVAMDSAGKQERLWSLDAFRGFDMLMIMGMDSLVISLGVLVFGGTGGWLADQMRHPDWFGLSFYDTIFPTFLFIAGISFPFSLAKQRERGQSVFQIDRKIVVRGVLLIALGLVYNRILRLDFANFRYASVLGKIGFAWALAALAFVHFGRRTRIGICLALVAGYAILLKTVVASDFPDASSLSVEGNFVGWLDRRFMPGKLYQSGLCDPSGVFCNFFAAATAMLGMFAGEIVRSSDATGAQKTLRLVLFGIALLVAGLAMTTVIPLSKKLWSPSFTLAVGGYSALLFALFYWLVDVKVWRQWTYPLRVIGLNSIAIYMLQRIVDFRGIARFFLGGVASKVPEAAGAVILAAGYVALCWLLLVFLDRKKTYFKV